MKKINLKKIAGSEILSAKDLKAILGGDDPGSGSGSNNPCDTKHDPLGICGGNCKTGTGAASKCAVKQSTGKCTCGGL